MAGGAAEPKTDRELLLKLDGEIGRLAEAVSSLVKSLEDMEEKRISVIDERLKKMENVWAQVSGGWKFAMVLWFIISATGIIGLVKWFSGR